MSQLFNAGTQTGADVAAKVLQMIHDNQCSEVLLRNCASELDENNEPVLPAEIIGIAPDAE
ncbi:MAG: hypothetical protein E6Q97_17605 [Desulfurellales bacterium]|nr:MAG: hypothetical protein E6Q97_17605 [Desulfurellales bacterium]